MDHLIGAQLVSNLRIPTADWRSNEMTIGVEGSILNIFFARLGYRDTEDYFSDELIDHISLGVGINLTYIQLDYANFPGIGDGFTDRDEKYL